MLEHCEIRMKTFAEEAAQKVEVSMSKEVNLSIDLVCLVQN